MAFLSHRSIVDEESGTCLDEISFYGRSLEDADTEMRQWLIHTLPFGSCDLSLIMTYTTNGTQHEIFLRYMCTRQAADDVEPKGILREA